MSKKQSLSEFRRDFPGFKYVNARQIGGGCFQTVLGSAVVANGDLVIVSGEGVGNYTAWGVAHAVNGDRFSVRRTSGVEAMAVAIDLESKN